MFSFNKVWIHSMWSTKNCSPIIDPSKEDVIFGQITKELTEINCPVKIVNGTSDHVHSIFRLNPQQSVAGVIKQVKGASSHWINQNNVIDEKFSWQKGYGAFSVSDSEMEELYRYVLRQKEHHDSKTFQQEFEEFVRKHGLFYGYNAE